MSSPEQLTLLRNAIIELEEVSVEAKQCLLWVLDHTENLTKPVLLIFGDDKTITEPVRDIKSGVYDMTSGRQSKKLNEFMRDNGINFFMSSYYTVATLPGQDEKLGYIVWGTPDKSRHHIVPTENPGHILSPDLEAIRKIPLTAPSAEIQSLAL